MRRMVEKGGWLHVIISALELELSCNVFIKHLALTYPLRSLYSLHTYRGNKYYIFIILIPGLYVRT